jgi:lipopolysaccharide biosynthesis protein
MKPRLLAIYLPQYHPIPENDEWWGKGYTEWISVAQAKPLFKNHYQPIIPGELGFYDLRLEEIQVQQAELAKEYGIEGFCYWHYWLGNGKCLLELPFENMLKSKKIDFPFCLSWANHSWKGVFFGAKGQTLIEQEYPGVEDYKAHFYALLPAFRDERYIRVNGKPLFGIFKPNELPDCKDFIDLWNNLAVKEGLDGITFYGECYGESKDKYGLDFSTYSQHRVIEHKDKKPKLLRKLDRILHGISPSLKAYPYSDAMNYFLKEVPVGTTDFPSIIPGWDTTARLGKEAVILYNSTPDFFRKHIQQVFNAVRDKEPETNIVFVKSWNEWAEGNYIEPDRKWGRKYLEVLKDELESF